MGGGSTDDCAELHRTTMLACTRVEEGSKEAEPLPLDDVCVRTDRSSPHLQYLKVATEATTTMALDTSSGPQAQIVSERKAGLKKGGRQRGMVECKYIFHTIGPSFLVTWPLSTGCVHLLCVIQ